MLAEEAAEVGGLAGDGGGLRFVHRNSRAREGRTDVAGRRRYVLLILNKLGGEEGGKTGQVCPVCRSSRVREVPPTGFMIRLGWRIQGGGGWVLAW